MALAAFLVLTGCGSVDQSVKVAHGPVAAPSPTPPPRPVVQPVAGTVEVVTEEAAWNDQLGLADDGPPADGSVEAATESVATALNQFLDSVQVGEPALEHVRGVWLRHVDPAAAEVLERGLANPDNPVTAASYLMRVQLEPNPTLVATNVQVQRHDDTSVTVEMVFDVTGDRPLLHLVGAAEVL